MKPIVAVTMGDPGGIGPEVILKSLKAFKSKNVSLVLIGSREVFEYAMKRLKLYRKLQSISFILPSFLKPGTVYFLDVTYQAQALYQNKFKTKVPGTFSIGNVARWNGALSFAALQIAAREAAFGRVQAVVTAPIQKEAIQLIEPGFTGHTEYLAQTSKTKKFAMMFVGKTFHVTLATIHLSLKRVSAALKKNDLIDKIKLTNDFLKQRLKIKKPRIGVCALNPHGSEFGNEEKKIILPAVQAAQKHKIQAKGPFSGDQIFYDAYQGKWDAVLAMYHDQGLAPFKMIAFDEGVNTTLGLPYVRTSPDHGTAFDLAYQNKARHRAFLNALLLAVRLVS